MRKKILAEQITAFFEQTMPSPKTELNYSNPFELLVAVMLSAQCTDKRVNMVTPELFRHYPTPETLATADTEDVKQIIASISYPNAKAQHLIEMAKKLYDDFAGQVPQTIDELTTLQGVGRKTANVMLSVCFSKNAMPVDTHVFRVSHRLGLVSNRHTTPLSVERELTKLFPEHLLGTAHHWLLLHGRYTCTARTPKCKECGLNLLCKHYKRD